MFTCTFDDLREIARNSKDNLYANAESVGRSPMLMLHWSAGHYGQPFEDYHINIDQDGTIIMSTDDLSETKSHTWKMNTGNIGISMLCCAFATTNDLGEEPPTEQQIETMSKIVAILCQELGLICDYNSVRTHAEQADEQLYGPSYTCERWDLAILHNGEEMMSAGNTLRGKANWYCENM